MSSKRAAKRAKAKKAKFRSRIYWGLLVVVLIGVFSGLIFLQNRAKRAAFGEGNSGVIPVSVSVDEAYNLQKEGAFVLDVRQPDEWVDFHAPNSTLIPLDQLEARLDEVPKDKDIVVICRSGNRSQTGRDILLDAGFASVTSVTGGLTEWRSSGFPTVSGP